MYVCMVVGMSWINWFVVHGCVISRRYMNVCNSDVL